MKGYAGLEFIYESEISQFQCIVSKLLKERYPIQSRVSDKVRTMVKKASQVSLHVTTSKSKMSKWIKKVKSVVLTESSVTVTSPQFTSSTSQQEISQSIFSMSETYDEISFDSEDEIPIPSPSAPSTPTKIPSVIDLSETASPVVMKSISNDLAKALMGRRICMNEDDD